MKTWTPTRLYAQGRAKVATWARCSGPARGGHHCDTWTCRMAAAYGHLSVLMWAVANACPLDRDECIACASSAGHGLVVEYLTEMGQ